MRPGTITRIADAHGNNIFVDGAANRRTTLTLPNGVTVAYTYDSDSRMSGITYTAGGTQLGNLSYSYNADGRRTAVGGSLAAVNLPAAVSGNTFNADNGMTGFNGTTLSGACPEWSRRNASGNLTSDGTNTYTWDARHHLTAISGAATASFVYDALGRRMSKTVNGVTTQFLYDGLNPVQELNASNGVTANLLTGLGIDQYFTRTDSSGTMAFLRDALGSTVGLVNSAGSIGTGYTYEPFGNTTINGSSSNAFQFTGRENDGTGLYYYRARYYSPQFQRFIAQDPIGFGGGDPNLYAYVGNDPVDLYDSQGLWTLAVGWTVGGSSGWLGGGFTLGFAIDDSGHIAFFGTGAGGAGLGANTYSGLTVSVSNAPCVTDLGGPFGNQSFGAGLGLDTNVDVFEGRAASNGQNIIGWGLTVGEGFGSGGSIGFSKTVIAPLGTL